MVQFLLENGAKTDSKNEKGWTAMMAAAAMEYDNTAGLLSRYENLKDPDECGRTPLWFAARDHEEFFVYFMVTVCGDVDVKADEDGTTPLMQLCKKGKAKHIELVEEFVKRGADVNARGKCGLTPLMHLCSNVTHWEVKEDVVRLLLDGADINAKDEGGKTALAYLLRSLRTNAGEMEMWHTLATNMETARLMITEHYADVNAKDEDGSTPFMDLCRFSMKKLWRDLVDTEFMRQLVVTYGADVNTRDRYEMTPLMIVCESSKADTEILYTLIDSGADVNARYSDGMTLLMRAAQSGFLPFVQILLGAGAGSSLVDNEGLSALDHARLRGNNESIEELFASPETVHLALRPIMEKRLRFACEMGDLEQVTRLVNVREVAVNAADNATGTTPLHLACKNGHVHVVEFLLKQVNSDTGATALNELMNAANAEGHTALHLATLGGHMNVVKRLVEHGADADVKDNDGSTALGLAASAGNLEIAKFCLKVEFCA